MPTPEQVARALGRPQSVDWSGSLSKLNQAELQNPDVGEALAAVEEAERSNYTGPVVDLLRSDDVELPKRSRYIIADWLERHELKGRRGRPRTPSHEYSLADSALVLAQEEVDRLRGGGIRSSVAMKRVAEKCGIDEETLRNFCADRRGSSRRQNRL